MAEMILPGTYIEVRPEGLIAPGQIGVGNIGVVGTAAKGPIGVPQLLGSMPDALSTFYAYDSWIDPATNQKRVHELTLTRALELLFDFGATTVFAVRVGDGSEASATYAVPSGAGAKTCALLTAKSPGTWGNDLAINVVVPAAQDAFVVNEKHNGPGPVFTLNHKPAWSARNRVVVNAGGSSSSSQIVSGALPTPGQAELDTATKQVTLPAAIQNTDSIEVSYVVAAADAALVTLQLGHTQETYTVVDGTDLIAQVAASGWVDGSPSGTGTDLPDATPIVPNQPPVFVKFAGGKNGENAGASAYQTGLDALLNREAHIIVAAGQDQSFGNKLDAHCQKASTDAIKHDRIGVTGSARIDPVNFATSFDTIIGHNLDSDRIVFVTPGILSADAPTGTEVTLPGAYAAAAFAGFLSSLPAHISATNKTLPVDELETHFDAAHLTQLLENRVLALESRQGFHIVRGITTTTGGAFAQITTRRIVDYAKFGVRSAADPYIGLLNNERVRGALRATLNAFLGRMVEDEMLTTYDVAVTATRAQEIQGIVAVTMTLQPVFSIDFIKVTMFLQ
jgi:Phage tail sheath C-terminal domain/Phage tail sheath protein subtilisin-like domain